MNACAGNAYLKRFCTIISNNQEKWMLTFISFTGTVICVIHPVAIKVFDV